MAIPLAVGILIVMIGFAMYKRPVRQLSTGVWVDSSEHHIDNRPSRKTVLLGLVVAALGAIGWLLSLNPG